MEVETAVFLAAGKGERMMPLTKDRPKCLLDYGGVSILKRTVFQLINCGIRKIFVVVGYDKEKIIDDLKYIKGAEIEIIDNEKYDEDVNIYSLLLAMNHVSDPFLLIEADTIGEDDLIEHLTSDKYGGRSVWFINGCFREGQYGGILKADNVGNIVDIRIVPKFQKKYEGYKKFTGIVRIGKNELKSFKDLLAEYAARTIRQYYLTPWIENIGILPAIEADISIYDFATFNMPEEYYAIINHKTFMNKYSGDGIHLIEVERLKHIEGFSNKKVKQLKEKIMNEGKWTKPICVEKNHLLVLDGQHRLEVARLIGIRKIPSMLFNYRDVKFWSLRNNHKLSIKSVCEKALSGDIYPYKTVKHDFHDSIRVCNFRLNKLK